MALQRTCGRRWAVAIIITLAALTAIAVRPAGACTFAPGPMLKMMERWKTTCTHPLCGTLFAADPSRLKHNGNSCESDPYFAFRRDTLSAAAAETLVLLGEVHDNPAHHA